MDETTQQVAELYADYPYPNHGVISTVVANLAGEYIRLKQRELGAQELRLLDAGCGTGETTLGLARSFPDLDIVGVDISKASLERAEHFSYKANSKVRFEQRDLMKPLENLGTFDVITSIGVLHHLAEPGTGLRHLAAIANEGACLVGMVYGHFGSWPLMQVLEALTLMSPSDSRSVRLACAKQIRWGPTVGLADRIQSLRHRRLFGPSVPIRETILRNLRGRNDAFQADTYGHVQELKFTWLELAELLQDTGWAFEGWPKRSGMPDEASDLLDGETAELVKSLPLLKQAAIMERLVRPSNLYFVARLS